MLEKIGPAEGRKGWDGEEGTWKGRGYGRAWAWTCRAGWGLWD